MQLYLDIEKYRQKVLDHSFEFLEEKRVLAELLRGITSGKSVRCEERPPSAGENGVLKVSAVTWGEFAPKESKTLPRHFKPPPKAKVRKGGSTHFTIEYSAAGWFRCACCRNTGQYVFKR